MTQDLRRVPLQRRLGRPADLREYFAQPRFEPAGLPATYLLERVGGPHPNDGIRAGDAGEQLAELGTVGKHLTDHFSRSSEGSRGPSGEHGAEVLRHRASIAVATAAIDQVL
ncbi:hypothetical protein [Paraconexibacter sp.]|uniref:hypothetical protein n=1 Tax=Paraconexibacter sp. TaxID=2949640 RepID=UPI0035621B7B